MQWAQQDTIHSLEHAFGLGLMDVAVVGAGIIGILTSHFLLNRGCRVTVYEQANGPAELTSHANGGQLSYSFCDTMADPMLLPRLPAIMIGRDPAIKIKPSLQPAFLHWGLRFLAQCRRKRR